METLCAIKQEEREKNLVIKPLGWLAMHNILCIAKIKINLILQTDIGNDGRHVQ